MLSTDGLVDNTFTKTRRRDGYDLGEVDAFVTEVREALGQRDTQISALQQQIAVLRLETRAPAPAQPAQQPDDRKGSSAAAVRLLEIATDNADRLAAEAKAEAESVVAAARAEADGLLAAARTEADRHATSARAEVEQFTAEASRERSALEAQLDHLRQQEHSHRDHLRRHFSEQLARLDEADAPSLRAVD